MKNNISKILDATLSRTVFDLKKADIRHSYLDYIALAILRDDGSMAYRLLTTKLPSWEMQQLPHRIEDIISRQPIEQNLSIEEFVADFRLRLIDLHSDSRRISTAHALCHIVADTTTATSQVLSHYGITVHSIEAMMREVSSTSEGMSSRVQPSDSLFESSTNGKAILLDQFGEDMTRLARNGKIDPVVGRDKEIDRVIQILSRRKKNNPILIGEAGVGKSAIVEGLALRIVAGDVPASIRGKRLFSLDVSSIVAGTKFRGEFEERIQQLIDELRQAKDTIIFIDEIHTIVGAGSTQGSLDAANILKPALARGEVQTIGATTLDEFRENIERDSALERRFQKIIVEPTTAEQTIAILRRVAPYYERYHNVSYSEEALQSCVRLCERYITDRHFPDKAIDVIDEAGAMSHIRSHTMPDEIQQLEQELDSHTHQRHKAIATLAYEKASLAQLHEIALRSRLDEKLSNWKRSQPSPRRITAADIERVVTSLTGIPAHQLSQSEAERLRTLGDHLRQRVIGQSEAVERITRSLMRSRSGMEDADRPVGVFLFVGPTGVGKTMLAKELSKYMFDHKQGLIRIDMSEYAQSHNVARLIGSPPGYVGYGDGGQLTEAVRRHPYSVVLFDEVEKAHPEIFNSMLQIFDEGHLTDGAGRKIDFRNTIIILTSNVGSRKARERIVQAGFRTPSNRINSDSAPEGEYRKALEAMFAPEFLNRIDEVVCFRSLQEQDMAQIVELEIERILLRASRLGLRVEVSDKAKEQLTALGYDARYGARALRRTLRDRIEDPLSTLIIEGHIEQGDKVKVESNGAEITLRVA